MQERGNKKWKTIYFGSDDIFNDVVHHSHVPSYRICTWNSYARCKHMYATINIGYFSFAYYFYFGNLMTFVFFILHVIQRLYHAGYLSGLLRIVKQLSPNIVQNVRAVQDKGTVHVTWDHPLDNGTTIIQYTVHVVKLGENNSTVPQEIVLTGMPLPCRMFFNLVFVARRSSYHVFIKATNESGQSSTSIQTHLHVYSIDELPSSPTATEQQKQRERNRLLPHDKCYICLNPTAKASIPLLSRMSSKFLHNCSVCERRFCHHHRGKVTHQLLFACRANQGTCLCVECPKKKQEESSKRK